MFDFIRRCVAPLFCAPPLPWPRSQSNPRAPLESKCLVQKDGNAQAVATPEQSQSAFGTECRKQWKRSNWCHTRRAPERLWNVIDRHTSFSTSRRCNSYLAFKGEASGSAFAELLPHFNSGATARPGCPQYLARNEDFHLAKIKLRFHGFLEGA